MVFYLAKSVVQAGRTRRLTRTELRFFAGMAAAHYSGFCYLCGDNETLDFLQNNLGTPAKEDYAQLAANYANHQKIMDAVSKVFVLTMLDEPGQEVLPETLADKDRHEFLKVSDAICLEWVLNHRCCLLTENDSDSVFYQYIANYWLDRKERDFRWTVQCNLEGIGCGGSTIGDRLKSTVQNYHRPALCVVDTDWKYGKIAGHEPVKGSTWGAADNAKGDLQTSGMTLPPFRVRPLCIYEAGKPTLCVHEAENLIPMDFLQKLREGHIRDRTSRLQYKHGLETLKKLKKLRISDSRLGNFQVGSPALYYDYKNGIPYIPHGENQKEQVENKNKREYWETILTALRKGKGKGSIPYKEAKIKPCFPKLHKDVLQLANTGIFVDANQYYQKCRELTPYIKPTHLETPLDKLWEDIGQCLFTWGCASVETTIERESALSFSTRF